MYFALNVRGRLQEGDVVLVHGAAGGIGTSTLRLARVLGAARTIAVVSTEEKGQIATAAGATDVVLAEGFKDAVKELTNGRGVDVVVDPVGGDRFTDSLRSLAPGGRLLVVGFTGGEIPTVKVNRLLLNNIDVVGVGWGAWAGTHPGALTEQWTELAKLLTSGKLSPPEPDVYPLDEAAAAVASLENRTAKGKVVLRVR
jgi:NADPH2:quinone reductase